MHEITSSRWLLIYCISCICPSIWRLSGLMMQGRAAQCMVMGAWRAQDHYFPISPSLTPHEGLRECRGHHVSLTSGVATLTWPLILTSPPPLVSRHWQQGSGLYHRVMFSSVHCAGLCNAVMQSDLCVPWRACTAHQQPSCRAWEILPLSVANSTSLLLHIRLCGISRGNNPLYNMDHQ